MSVICAWLTLAGGNWRIHLYYYLNYWRLSTFHVPRSSFHVIVTAPLSYHQHDFTRLNTKSFASLMLPSGRQHGRSDVPFCVFCALCVRIFVMDDGNSQPRSVARAICACIILPSKQVVLNVKHYNSQFTIHNSQFRSVARAMVSFLDKPSAKAGLNHCRASKESWYKVS